MNPVDITNPINVAIFELSERFSSSSSSTSSFSLPAIPTLIILFVIIFLFLFIQEKREQKKIKEWQEENSKTIKFKDVKYRGKNGIHPKK